MDTQVYIKNVTTLQYDTQKCTGCRKCVDVCPHGVFTMQNKKAVIVAKDKCMECGACVTNCSTNALWVKKGVGCATAIIWGWFTGNEPSCDCSNSSNCC